MRNEMKNLDKGMKQILEMEKGAKDIMARSTIRPFILLTLIHTEMREDVDQEIIIARIIKLFQCVSVVLATEKHKDKPGIHYHIGILAKDASKNTLRRKLREAFREWDGRSIDIALHKGWGTICKYIMKEDKKPIVWGEYSIDQIKAVATAAEKHKEANTEINNIAILKRLEEIEDWYQVYRDETLKNKVLTALPRMKEAFEDLKVLRDIETSVLERIIDYLAKKGEPKEYDVEELREKYLIIDWIACQICFKRPIKTKQLFIYGEPSTQKTLLINCLSKVVKVYFASARKNDFAGANDYYDLWVFDEFHEHTEQDPYWGNTTGSTAEGTAFVNNLLKVLDGQECRLDSKYSRIFKKKKNVPIIMIANKLPYIMQHHGPFRARFMRVRFTTKIKDMKEERIIATLYGCILRRAMRSPYVRKKETPQEVALDYNGSEALIIPKAEEKTGKEEFLANIEAWNRAIMGVNNPMTTKNTKSEDLKWLMRNSAFLMTREGKVYKIRAKIVEVKVEYKILVFEIVLTDGIEWKNWTEEERDEKINILEFANIPVKKKNKNDEKKKKDELSALFEEPKKNQESEEKNQEIQVIKNIFQDNEEREWIRFHAKEEQIRNQEVWSVIRVQRSGDEKKDDYVMWPLEIKLYLKKGEGQTIIKIFPAIIENEEKHKEEEEEFQQEKKIMQGTLQETREEILKCEIALSRNGEGQKWNLNS